MPESFDYKILLEKEGYGPDDSDRGSHETSFLEAAVQRKGNRQKKITTVLTGLLVLLNILWTIFLFTNVLPSHCHEVGTNLIPSPAREAVAYEKVITNSTIDSMNKFKGFPRPELDEAWEDGYLRWPNIVVSEDDLKAVNRTSIKLTDGSGFLGTLGVFHQIHCLDYIRKYIFKDYYPTYETPERRWQHVDHCFDELRLSLMCHGDISLITWGWVDTEATPFANFRVEHECRNWEKILTWTKAHQADPAAIVRPQKYSASS